MKNLHFKAILRRIYKRMKKYTEIVKKTKYWVELNDSTGYRRTRRTIYTDKMGEYIIIEGVKRYV